MAFETGLIISVDSRVAKQGATEVTRAIDGIGASATNAQRSTDTAFGRIGGSVSQTGENVRRLRGQIQQLSFQINDVVSQLASGTAPMTVLTQQGGQIAQIFGPLLGVGGVLAIGVAAIVKSFVSWGDETERLSKAMEVLRDVSTDALKKSKEFTEAQRANALRDVQDRIAILTSQRAALEQTMRSAGGGEMQIGDMPTISKSALDRQLAELNRVEAGFLIAERQRSDEEDLKVRLENIKQQGVEQQKNDVAAAKAQTERIRRDQDYWADQSKREMDELKHWDGVLKSIQKKEKAVANDIDRLEEEARLEGLSNEEREVGVALLREQAKLYDDQGNKIRDLTEDEKKRIENAVKLKNQFEEQAKAADKARREMEHAVERSTDRLVDFAGDAIFDRLTGKAKSFWESFKDFGLRTISQLAAEMVFRPIIAPVVASVVGGVMGGSRGGLGNLGFGGGGFDLGSVFNLGSNLFSGGNGGSLLGGIGNLLGFGGGAATGPGGLAIGGGAASSGAVGAAGFGSFLGPALGAAGLGFGIGQLGQQLFGGNKVGGGILGGLGGGIAGGLMIGGPFGAAIGAVAGILGGVLGGKASVGPNANANLILSGGQFGVGASAADNGGNVQQAIQTTQQLAQALNTVTGAYGLKTAGAGFQLDAGYFKDQLFLGAGGGPGVNMLTQSSDPDALALSAFRTLYGRGAISGASGAIAGVINSSQATTLSGLASDLDIAKFYDSIVKMEKPLNAASQAAQDLGKRFDEMSGKVAGLGLDVNLFNQKFRETFDRDIQDAILAITNPLQLALEQVEQTARARLDLAKKLGADLIKVEELNALERKMILDQSAAKPADLSGIIEFQKSLTTSNLSPLSPLGQITEAQALFNETLKKAQGGDAAAINALPGVGQSLLRLGQGYYASGTGYQDLFRGVNEGLGSVLNANSGGRDLALVFQTSTADIVAAQNATIEELGGKLEDLKKEMRNLILAVKAA